MKNSESTGRVILIQFLVLIAFLGILEGAGQIWERWLKEPESKLGMHVAPYVMFNARSGAGNDWYNQITKQKIPNKVIFNNYGYAEDFDYMAIPTPEYIRQHGKKEGEILVLMGGGSTVHGVGASDNNHTISAQMERYLNERGGGKKFRVLNMGMGSWIAYQEFIGLSMLGAPLNPDWVVVMDGMNDGAVACAQGSGAGNPLNWARMLFLLQGGKDADGVSPTIAALGRHSALIRSIFGVDVKNENALPTTLEEDRSVEDKRFQLRLAGLKTSVQDDQLRFYMQAQQNLLNLFPRANMILSTAPAMYDNGMTFNYRKTFHPSGTAKDRAALEKDLDDYMKQKADKACNINDGPALTGYFLARSALALQDFVANAKKKDTSRHIEYVNTEASMPYAEEKRGRFFLDNGHMMDDGQERIGELYAEMILAAESKKPFNLAAFKRFHGEE